MLPKKDCSIKLQDHGGEIEIFFNEFKEIEDFFIKMEKFFKTIKVRELAKQDTKGYFLIVRFEF